jgi:hypothetical protein
MKDTRTPQRFSLKGRVIEIFQKGGNPVTRVSVDSFYLDIPSTSALDAHLKDVVVIDGSMTIEDVRNDFTATLSSSQS